MEYGPRHVTREEIWTSPPNSIRSRFISMKLRPARPCSAGLCASGWHSCCILMRMMADGFVLNSSSMGAPGVDEVLWLAPIRPGDDLTLRATVLSTRASSSRPDMGFVNIQLELYNAAAKRVMSLKAPLMFGRRTPGAAA